MALLSKDELAKGVLVVRHNTYGRVQAVTTIPVALPDAKLRAAAWKRTLKAQGKKNITVISITPNAEG